MDGSWKRWRQLVVVIRSAELSLVVEEQINKSAAKLGRTSCQDELWVDGDEDVCCQLSNITYYDTV